MTITISGWEFADQASAKSIQALIDQFQQENPTITVKTVPIQFLNYLTQVTTMIGGGQAPDVLQMYTIWLAGFAGDGALAPLDAYVTPDLKADTLNYQDGVVNGKTYGLEQTVGSQVMFVNKNVLKSAGLDPDLVPKTWADVQTICTAVVKLSGVNCLAITTAEEPSVWYWWQPLLKAYGGDVFDSSGKCILDDAAGVAMMNEMKTWAANHWITSGINADAARLVFAQNKAALLTDGPWMKGIFRQISGLGPAFDSQYSTIEMPVGPKAAQSWTAAAAHELSISAQSAHKPEAWKLLQFFARPDVQIKFFNSFGDTPASKKASADPAIAGDPFLQVFTAASEKVAPMAFGPHWPAASDFWMAGVEAVLAGADPQPTLTAACKSIATVQPPATP